MKGMDGLVSARVTLPAKVIDGDQMVEVGSGQVDLDAQLQMTDDGELFLLLDLAVGPDHG